MSHVWADQNDIGTLAESIFVAGGKKFDTLMKLGLVNSIVKGSSLTNVEKVY